MITLNKRLQLVEKDEEATVEKNNWKRIAIVLIIGEVLGFILMITAYVYVRQRDPRQQGLVPVWVEPKYHRSVERYYRILKDNDNDL